MFSLFVRLLFAIKEPSLKYEDVSNVENPCNADASDEHVENGNNIKICLLIY